MTISGSLAKTTSAVSNEKITQPEENVKSSSKLTSDSLEAIAEQNREIRKKLSETVRELKAAERRAEKAEGQLKRTETQAACLSFGQNAA